MNRNSIIAALVGAALAGMGRFAVMAAPASSTPPGRVPSQTQAHGMPAQEASAPSAYPARWLVRVTDEGDVRVLYVRSGAYGDFVTQ